MKINENDIEESMNEVIKAQKLVKIVLIFFFFGGMRKYFCLDDA